jgi:hypothetical protein
MSLWPLIKFIQGFAILIFNECHVDIYSKCYRINIRLSLYQSFPSMTIHDAYFPCVWHLFVAIFMIIKERERERERFIKHIAAITTIVSQVQYKDPCVDLPWLWEHLNSWRFSMTMVYVLSSQLNLLSTNKELICFYFYFIFFSKKKKK